MKLYKGMIVFLIAQAIFISGCAIISHGRVKRITMSKVENIEIGVSTKEDIIKEFGRPQQTMYKPDGTEAYIYTHGVEKSVIIPFLISVGRAGGTSQTLKVIFQADTVIDYEFIVDERAMTK